MTDTICFDDEKTDAIEEQAISDADDEEYVEIDGRKGIFTISEVVSLLTKHGIKVRIMMHNGRKTQT